MFTNSERHFFFLFVSSLFITFKGRGYKFLASGHDLRGIISHFDACLCGAPDRKKAFP